MMSWRVNDGILLIPLLPLSLSLPLRQALHPTLSPSRVLCSAAALWPLHPEAALLLACCNVNTVISTLSLSVPFLDCCAIVAFFTLSVALRASFSATFHRSDKAKLGRGAASASSSLFCVFCVRAGVSGTVVGAA
jgi:hypothetical protein